MTQQEQQLLNGLVERVNGTQLQNKDAEAEQLLTSSLQRNPDALYILCQTVLVQQFAIDKSQRDLQAARAEIDQLKQQPGKQEHGSFLGNLFGLGKGDDKPAPPVPPQMSSSSQPGYAPVNNPSAAPYGYTQQPPPPGYGYGGGYAPPGYAAPMGGGMFGGGGGGFMQGAMQTAAGVVAGEFAFRAIEDVFSGFGHGGGRGFEGGNEVVNNYYGGGNSGQDGGLAHRLQASDGFDSGISPDIEDRRGDSHGFLGGDSGDSGTSSFAGSSDDDGSYGDGSSNGDSGNDGGGSYDSGNDDGGSYDSGNDDSSF